MAITEGDIMGTDRRRFSDEDIAQLAAAIAHQQQHVCRYSATPEEIREAIQFIKHVNALMNETGSTIRKTILVAGVGGLLSILMLGVWAKIRTSLGL